MTISCQVCLCFANDLIFFVPTNLSCSIQISKQTVSEIAVHFEFFRQEQTSCAAGRRNPLWPLPLRKGSNHDFDFYCTIQRLAGKTLRSQGVGAVLHLRNGTYEKESLLVRNHHICISRSLQSRLMRRKPMPSHFIEFPPLFLGNFHFLSEGPEGNRQVGDKENRRREVAPTISTWQIG